MKIKQTVSDGWSKYDIFPGYLGHMMCVALFDFLKVNYLAVKTKGGGGCTVQAR